MVFSLINGIPVLVINLGIKHRQMECRNKQNHQFKYKTHEKQDIVKPISYCTGYTEKESSL